jgi:hypothetical protein
VTSTRFQRAIVAIAVLLLTACGGGDPEDREQLDKRPRCSVEPRVCT